MRIRTISPGFAQVQPDRPTPWRVSRRGYRRRYLEFHFETQRAVLVPFSSNCVAESTRSARSVQFSGGRESEGNCQDMINTPRRFSVRTTSLIVAVDRRFIERSVRSASEKINSTRANRPLDLDFSRRPNEREKETLIRS